MIKKCPYQKDSTEWERLANNLARNYAPQIYDCKKCGYPVISGYSCNKCGSSTPYQENDDE